LTFTIRRRTIPSRVRIIKDEHIRAAAQTVHRYLCCVHDDSRRGLGRRRPLRGEHPRAGADRDALSPDARSLPVHTVTAIVAQLVRLKRLNAPNGSSAPLIRLDMGRSSSSPTVAGSATSP